MKRRQFLSTIAAALGGIGAAVGIRKRQRHVILNYREMSRFEREFSCGRCLVDGVAIPLVWYVDTRRGFVKTYGVHDSHTLVAAPGGGVLSRTIYGNVELFRGDGSRL